MKKILSVLMVSVLLCFMSIIIYASESNCDYSKMSKKYEIYFLEKDLSTQKYGYSVTEKPTLGGQTDYTKLVNKTGKIEKIVEDKISKYYKIVMSDCSVYYAHASGEIDYKIHGTCNPIEIDKAKNLINKDIWVNANYQPKLLTEDKNNDIELSSYEKVKVIDILLKQLAHMYSYSDFFLVVERNSGEIGYLYFNPKSYYLTYPLKKSWSKKVLNAIENKEVFVGMSKEQAILSWGEPKDINRTVTSNGTSEQYIYGESYLYFKNNKLTAIQD